MMRLMTVLWEKINSDTNYTALDDVLRKYKRVEYEGYNNNNNMNNSEEKQEEERRGAAVVS